MSEVGISVWLSGKLSHSRTGGSFSWILWVLSNPSTIKPWATLPQLIALPEQDCIVYSIGVESIPKRLKSHLKDFCLGFYCFGRQALSTQEPISLDDPLGICRLTDWHNTGAGTSCETRSSAYLSTVCTHSHLSWRACFLLAVLLNR